MGHNWKRFLPITMKLVMYATNVLNLYSIDSFNGFQQILIWFRVAK